MTSSLTEEGVLLPGSQGPQQASSTLPVVRGSPSSRGLLPSPLATAGSRSCLRLSLVPRYSRQLPAPGTSSPSLLPPCWPRGGAACELAVGVLCSRTRDPRAVTRPRVGLPVWGGLIACRRSSADGKCQLSFQGREISRHITVSSVW